MLLVSRSPLKLLVGGRHIMHDSSCDLLGGGGKRAKSTLSCVGTLPPTTLASMARSVVIAFDSVQTAPLTCSCNLAALGTCCGCSTRTPIDGRGRASQDLMVILSLSLLRGGGGWRHAHGCGMFLLTKGVSRKGCEHDSWLMALTGARVRGRAQIRLVGH